MSAALWLAFAEPAVLPWSPPCPPPPAPVHAAPPVTLAAAPRDHVVGKHAQFVDVVVATEAMFPATRPRIIEALGMPVANARRLLRGAASARLVERCGANYHATDAGLRLLTRAGARS